MGLLLGFKKLKHEKDLAHGKNSINISYHYHYPFIPPAFLFPALLFYINIF